MMNESFSGLDRHAVLGGSDDGFPWFASAMLAMELFAYALCCVAFSLPFTRSLDPPALLILPGVMAVYHVAYGLGFLIGSLRPPRRGAGPDARARFFTALTR